MDDGLASVRYPIWGLIEGSPKAVTKDTCKFRRLAL